MTSNAFTGEVTIPLSRDYNGAQQFRDRSTASVAPTEKKRHHEV